MGQAPADAPRSSSTAWLRRPSRLLHIQKHVITKLVKGSLTHTLTHWIGSLFRPSAGLNHQAMGEGGAAAAEMVGNEAAQALKGEPGHGHPGSDLFPHLDALVPCDITTWGVVRESYRLISQHLNQFELAVLFLTLQLALGFWFQFKQVYVPGSLVLMLLCLVEVGFAAAVVRVYLKERAAGYHNTSEARKEGAWRCLWTKVVTVLVGAVMAVVVGFVVYIKIQSGSLRIDAAFLLVLTGPVEQAVARTVWVDAALQLVFAGVPVEQAVATTARVDAALLLVLAGAAWISALFVVALPAAILSTASGFKALKQSFSLTRGHRMRCWALYVAIVALGSVTAAPLWLAQDSVTKRVRVILAVVSFFGQWLVSLIWYLVRNVLYLKLRAQHKVPQAPRVLQT